MLSETGATSLDAALCFQNKSPAFLSGEFLLVSSSSLFKATTIHNNNTADKLPNNMPDFTESTYSSRPSILLQSSSPFEPNKTIRSLLSRFYSIPAILSKIPHKLTRKIRYMKGYLKHKRRMVYVKATTSNQLLLRLLEIKFITQLPPYKDKNTTN